jgi:hypothetical protein
MVDGLQVTVVVLVVGSGVGTKSQEKVKGVQLVF